MSILQQSARNLAENLPRASVSSIFGLGARQDEAGGNYGNGRSAYLQFEDGIARLSQRIRASSRVAPAMYCIYFDLMHAVRRDDLDACARLLAEMEFGLDAPLPSFYSRWGALPESTTRRYLTYVNVDPTT